MFRMGSPPHMALLPGVDPSRWQLQGYLYPRKYTGQPATSQPATDHSPTRQEDISNRSRVTGQLVSSQFITSQSITGRPTGDQEVAGSTPAEVGNILSWRLIMKYFLQSFSPFCWFKKGSCQFLAKECAQYWLTA